MVKDGTLNTLAIIGYAFTAIFTVMALVIGIYWGVTGFKEKEKEIDALVFVAPENTDSEVITQNNTMNISTTEIQKIIGFSVAGTEQPPAEQASEQDVLTKKITLTINNEYKNFKAAPVDATSIWFVEKDENGNPKKVKDEETEEEHYVRLETNKLTARVDEKIYIMLATTTFDDETLKSFFLEEEVENYEYKTDIKGGLSYIHARSEDGLFVAKDLEVKVDVPVRSAKIAVEGYDYNGDYVDLTDKIAKTQNVEYDHIFTSKTKLDSFVRSEKTLGTTIYYETDEENSTLSIDNVSYTSGNFYTVIKDNDNNLKFAQNNDLTFEELQYFLEGTELKLSIKTFPENALMPLSKSIKNFEFNIFETNQNTARIKEDNKLEIDRDKTQNNSFEPGTIKIEAEVQVLLNSDSTIKTQFFVQSAQTEVATIKSKNDSMKENGEMKEITIPVNSTQTLYANKENENNLTHLDIEIIPKFYNKHNNPYAGQYNLNSRISNNHGEESGQVNIQSLGDTNKSYTDAITLTSSSQNSSEFTIKANRLLFGDEEYYLEISVDDKFEESKTIKIPISSSIVLPTQDELSLKQQHSTTVTKESADFLSAVIGGTITEDKVLEQGEIKDYLAVSVTKELTYNNWVYFLSDVKAKNETSVGTASVEEDSSDSSETSPETSTSNLAIKCTTAGQIVSKDGETFGNAICAQNQGTETISPKLVLCDEQGFPLNYKYERFTPDDNTGFILFDETTNFSDLTKDNDYENCYVVLFAPKINVSVKVFEQLTKFAFFYNYDTESGKYSNLFRLDATSQQGFNETIEVPSNQQKIVYAMANSSNALANLGANNQFGISFSEGSVVSNSSAIAPITKDDTTSGLQIIFTPNPSDITANIVNNEESFGSFNAKAIEVDVAKISGIYESTDSLTPYLTESDVGKIAYFTEESGYITISKTPIYNNMFAIGGTVYTIKDEIIEGNPAKNIYAEGSENPIPVSSNSFEISGTTYYINGNYVETRQYLEQGYYVVKSQTESGVTTYYWDEFNTADDVVWWNSKEIKMQAQKWINTSSTEPTSSESAPIVEIGYDPLVGNTHYLFKIPAKIYRTLNITKANGNEGVTLTGTYQDEYEIINYSGQDPLTLSTYGGVDKNNDPLVSTPDNIKLRKVEDYLYIDLYEGWQSKINNLYLVYKTSLISGQTTTIKAIDAYKLTFDNTNANYVITDKTSSTDIFVFDSSDKKLKSGETVVKISDLIKAVDMSDNNSTEYDISPRYITAKLFRGNEDLSQYILVFVTETGVTCRPPSNSYEFSDENTNINTKIEGSSDLKLVLYMFRYNYNDNSINFVIEINAKCQLGFNVNETASGS